MKVAIVSGSRATPPMGLELAEVRLLEAIRSRPGGIELDVRVVGRRGARSHARRIDARWIPARPGKLPRRATARADLVHLLGLDLPPPQKRPFVATVHDLSSLHYDDEGRLPPWIDEIAERASLILTPSRFTADEVRVHLGVPEDRIRVLGGAPALRAADATPLSSEELTKLGIATPFVLRYGGYTARKNVPLLLEAWSRLELGTLVLAGPAQAARDQILAASPSLDRVVVLDYVPETLLANLLHTASALVSTSSYEGFGLPLVEAMAIGAPVVAVSTPFAREVCDDAALLVESDPVALRAAVLSVVYDESLRVQLRERGKARSERFRWDKVGTILLDSYAEVSRAPQ